MRDIESKKEMKNFFIRNLSKGQKLEDIYSTLITQGYSKTLINMGYNEAVSELRERQKKFQENNPRPVTQERIEIIPEKKSNFFKKIFGKK